MNAPHPIVPPAMQAPPSPPHTAPAGPLPPRRSSRRGLVVVIALVVIALLVWLAMRLFEAPKKTPPPPGPVLVTLGTVQARDFDVYQAGVGTVTPNVSVTVRSRVDGELQKLGYTEGQDVKAGQLIAQLDPRTFQAQLAQAQATEARDQALLDNARRDLSRYNDLIADEATSQQTLDTQKSLVGQLSATVKNDQAQVAYAKTQLDYTTITAPISGRTGLRLVDVGNIVHAADTTGVVVIDQIDPITVVFTLPDGAFPQVNAAMRASPTALRAVAYTRDDSRPLATGRLALIDNHIDTTSGTFQLKAAFANADHALWPGQYVNMHLYVARRPQALVVPAAAVQRSQSGTYVYAIDAQGKAQMKPVEVALTQDGQSVVTKGVVAGERVVVDGQYKVKPGLAVTESRSGAPGASNAVGGGKTAGSASDAGSAGTAGGTGVASTSGGTPKTPDDAGRTDLNPPGQGVTQSRQ